MKSFLEFIDKEPIVESVQINEAESDKKVKDFNLSAIEKKRV